MTGMITTEIMMVMMMTNKNKMLCLIVPNVVIQYRTI